MRPSVWPGTGCPMHIASRSDVWTLASNEGPLLPVDAGFETCLGLRAFFSVCFLFITNLPLDLRFEVHATLASLRYPFSLLCVVVLSTTGLVSQPLPGLGLER